jgi:hypothetical protein
MSSSCSTNSPARDLCRRGSGILFASLLDWDKNQGNLLGARESNLVLFAKHHEPLFRNFWGRRRSGVPRS